MVETQREKSASSLRRSGVGLGLTVLLLAAVAFSALMADEGRVPRTPPELDADSAAAVARRVGAAFEAVQSIWRREMGRVGLTHAAPDVRYYTGATVSPCSDGQSTTGPFYCPGSVEAVFDLAFFEALNVRLRRNGDLGTALVVALISASHVQDELGLLDTAEALRRSGTGAGEVDSQLAAQADCLAGVWASLAGDSVGHVPVGFYDQLIGIARNVMEDQGSFAPEMPSGLDPFAAASRATREADFGRGYASGDPATCLPDDRVAGG